MGDNGTQTQQSWIDRFSHAFAHAFEDMMETDGKFTDVSERDGLLLMTCVRIPLALGFRPDTDVLLHGTAQQMAQAAFDVLAGTISHHEHVALTRHNYEFHLCPTCVTVTVDVHYAPVDRE